jgi:hypothetical protein
MTAANPIGVQPAGRDEHRAAAGDLAQHGRDRIDQGGDLFADGVPATGVGRRCGRR